MEEKAMEIPTTILVIITTDPEQLSGGGVPVFHVENKDYLEEVSFSLEKILDASAHRVTEGTMMIVAH